MIRARVAGACVLVVGAALSAVGCDTGGANKPSPATQEKGHVHPDEGPHHGALVEWGQEEYHPEVVTDREKGEVTVYVLGKDAKTPAPVAAEKVVLAVKDPAFQTELKPAPQPGDPKGKSSRFVGTLPEFARGRRLAGTIGAVVDGKPYSGDF